MPALSTVVTNYLNAVKGALQQGSDLGQDVRGAAQNYLRAQDMATVLELLQVALTTGALTATGGTTRSVSDGVGTFVPGQQVGNKVVFTGNTTTALTGVEAVVVSNTNSTLTFADILPDTPVSGDTFVLHGALAQGAIDALREGGSLGDAPRGSVYGDSRLVKDAMVRFLRGLSTVAATGTLTLTGNAEDGETVTIGDKVYTFQASLTDVDGNVDIGASASDSLDQLIAAINLGAGAGTAYADSMTLNPYVTAAAGDGDTMVVTAKAVSGSLGNLIAIDTDVADGDWDAVFLAGGSDGSAHERSMGSMLTAAGSTTSVVVVSNRGAGDLVIDSLRGLQVTISGESRRVVSNNETTLTLNAPLSSAPSASVTVALAAPDASTDASVASNVHPGSQPGENAMLGYLIGALQTAVGAYTLPT